MNVLVTGAVGGLGFALCRELHSQGCAVIAMISGRGSTEEDRWKLDWLGVNCFVLAVDLTRLCFDKVDANRFNHFDVVINCAGINHIDVSDDFHLDHIFESLSVNVMSPVYLAHTLLAKCMQGNKAGLVVNIGSTAAHAAGGNSLAYVMTKHALLGATRSLAKDWAKWDVSVVQYDLGKLAGTNMTDYIEHRQALMRGTTVEEERVRQNASGEPLAVESVAEEIVAAVLDISAWKDISGKSIKIGGY